MPLLRELRVRRNEETIAVHLKRADGTPLLTLDITRKIDVDRPLPVDIWVDRADDLIVEPPDAPVTLVWDEEPLGGLRLVQLNRRVPPHDAKDYIRYPALIAKTLITAGYARAVGADEEAELDSPRLYIPHGIPHFGARRD